ncbi:MFS transporter [Arthrobacter sp. VKM Ac-2550]|uniref:MFS transporter n=1 Tax=Crystallibacter permensis TaxID=1938888 RepID=UPI0022275DFA|nr:MFS transporter [Arthrobacter sp. VKM Ac-2550]MCW2130915.1 putative arabinose efflux permease, MFS family [Arthrobacter sp. VKM Ac-2550]
MSGSGRQSGQLWTKDFVLAIAVNLFISMVFYLLMTSMALYAVERFRASDTLAGLASSSFIIGSVMARIFAGWLLDVVGRRRLLLAALLVFVAASLLYIPAGSLPLLLALRIIHGMAFGAGSTAVAASVQALIPPARRSEGTGYFGLSTTLSIALGPFLAVLLSASGSYTGLFLFCAACSVAAFLIALTIRLPELPQRSGRKRGTGRRRISLAAVLEPDALPVSTVILACGVAYSGFLAFLTSYALEQGIASAASMFFLVYAVAVLVSRLFVGRIHDRRGDNAVIYPALAVFAAGLGLLALEPAVWSIAAAGALSGLGFGTLTPSVQAIAVTEAPEMRLGTATSTFYLMLDLGVGVGPVVLGALLPLTGYQGMFGALCVLVLAAVVLYYVVHGSKHRPPRAA